MRQIDYDAATALINRQEWKSGNTEVDRWGYDYMMFLHHNNIAKVGPLGGHGVVLKFQGYATDVTRRRLNAILDVTGNGDFAFHIRHGKIVLVWDALFYNSKPRQIVVDPHETLFLDDSLKEFANRVIVLGDGTVFPYDAKREVTAE